MLVGFRHFPEQFERKIAYTRRSMLSSILDVGSTPTVSTNKQDRFTLSCLLVWWVWWRTQVLGSATCERSAEPWRLENIFYSNLQAKSRLTRTGQDDYGLTGHFIWTLKLIIWQSLGCVWFLAVGKNLFMRSQMGRNVTLLSLIFPLLSTNF